MPTKADSPKKKPVAPVPMQLPNLGLDERQTAAAAATGLHANAIGNIKLSIAQLKRQAIMIRVHVYGSSLFEMQATWADLGVADGAKRRKNMKPPIKLLGPAEWIARRESIETRARNCPKEFGAPVTGFESYTAIMFTAFQKWKERWDGLLAEDELLKDEICASLPQVREQKLAEFTASAQEAWSSLLTKRKPEDVKENGVVVDGNTFRGRRQFVDYVVEQTLKRFPTKEDVRDRMRLEFVTAVFGSDSDIEQERKLIDQLKAEQAALEEKAAKALAEKRYVELKQWEEEQAAKKRLIMMHEAQMEAVLREIEHTANPLLEIVDRIRVELYDSIVKMKESVEKNGHVRGKIAEQAHGLMELYDLLRGGIRDKNAETLLAQLTDLIGPVGGGQRRDVDAITNTLEQLEEELKRKAAEVYEDQPDRFDFIEV